MMWVSRVAALTEPASATATKYPIVRNSMRCLLHFEPERGRFYFWLRGRFYFWLRGRFSIWLRGRFSIWLRGRFSIWLRGRFSICIKEPSPFRFRAPHSMLTKHDLVS
ncbi:protein of unknown function [Micropruina glycogenica]|uniref:Uncharacterized protein n=1 Tax=Micropruina glycogenica TaxID=75385 RepID=A0A2N9JFX9_9ACTN|nr:protein of unknown function [Micropruina glycogenica]